MVTIIKFHSKIKTNTLYKVAWYTQTVLLFHQNFEFTSLERWFLKSNRKQNLEEY